eukprot:Em0008g97a
MEEDGGEPHKELIEAIRKVWPVRPDATKALQQAVLPAHAAVRLSQEGVDAGTTAVKTTYRMESKPRGLAVIINNRNFVNMNARTGTDVDAKRLSDLFVYLGFEIHYFENLTTQQMRVQLDKTAKADHSKYDCLIIAVLSHGDEGVLYGTDSIAGSKSSLKVEELGTYFDSNGCPSLKGKPKVFILQACRGSNYDKGVKAPADFVDGGDIKGDVISDEEIAEQLKKQQAFKDHLTESLGMQGDMVDAPDSLPTKADFLYAYSTIPGYYSWRNGMYGSWFVKAFCDVMNEQAKEEHLMDMLIEVNRRVAVDFKSSDGSYKQIPGPVCLLTRKLYFRPGL